MVYYQINMDEATATEELERQREWELAQARREEREIKKALKKRKKKKLSFLQKISKHWLILSTAVLFDSIGMVLAVLSFMPFVGQAANPLGDGINFVFGAILWLYFTIRKTKGGNDLIDIGLPMLVGSFIDFFIGIMPTCTTAALIKIWKSK